MKEEDRLIATIAEIDEQTSLVPRGAFVLEPTGHVNINRCFEGSSRCHTYHAALQVLLVRLFVCLFLGS